MTPSERQKNILNQLKIKSPLKVDELSLLLGVSQVTIRNDLNEMEKQALLTRFHGGAHLREKQATNKSDKGDFELGESFNKNSYSSNDPKSRIARCAAKMVKPGATIILEGGSTTYLIAKELVNFNDITVITNNLPAAELLSHNKRITLVLCGGVLRHSTQSLHGALAEAALSGITTDIFFVGADGVDPINGITTFDENYTLCIAMAETAKTTVVVADNSKYGKTCFNQIFSPDKIDCLVMDDALSESEKQELERAGIKVILV